VEQVESIVLYRTDIRRSDGRLVRPWNMLIRSVNQMSYMSRRCELSFVMVI
jgi:hypothetical protein